MNELTSVTHTVNRGPGLELRSSDIWLSHEKEEAGTVWGHNLPHPL